MSRDRNGEQRPSLLAKLSSDDMKALLADRPASQPEPSRIYLRKCANCREYLTATQDACCGVYVPRSAA